MQRTLAWTACLLTVAAAAIAEEEGPAAPPPPSEPPLFENVTHLVGLEGNRGKACILTDLDGDGRLDLVLDRRHFFRNVAAPDTYSGFRFEAFEPEGLPFPEVEIVPMSKEFTADTENAKTREFVPQFQHFVDVNGDGHMDVVRGVKRVWTYFHAETGTWKNVDACDHGQRSSIYLGNGKGGFERAPDSAFSAPESAAASMALAICDVDRDGVLDLFEGCEYRKYGFIFGDPDRLWIGDGNGGFEDGTAAAGLATVDDPAKDDSSRPTYGVTHADIDGDGDQDLLTMSYGRQWNRLWLNDGTGKFTDVGRASGFAGDDITHGRYPDWVKRPEEGPFRSNGNTFDCAVADVNDDGLLDLFLGEIAHQWAGESSDLPAMLVQVPGDEGLRFDRRTVVELFPPRDFRPTRSWNYGDLHVAFLDFDLDTREDVLIASGDYPDGQFLRLYRQRENGTFEEATEMAGFDWEGCGGISLGDIDRDGDVDIVVGRSFSRLSQAHRDKFMGGIKVNEPAVFLNKATEFDNHWLVVEARGLGKGHANTAGIGARIAVTTGELTQIREVRCGSGLSGHQDALEAHFGLGKAEKIDRLTITWPDAKAGTQTFENVPVDRFVRLVQGADAPELSRAVKRAR